jgi:hypothetical protein
LSPFLFNIAMKVQASALRESKETKYLSIETEEIKLVA